LNYSKKNSVEIGLFESMQFSVKIFSLFSWQLGQYKQASTAATNPGQVTVCTAPSTSPLRVVAARRLRGTWSGVEFRPGILGVQSITQRVVSGLPPVARPTRMIHGGQSVGVGWAIKRRHRDKFRMSVGMTRAWRAPERQNQ